MSRTPTLTVVVAIAAAAVLSGCDPCSDDPGTICTWAGNGEAAFNGDGLDRHQTSFYWPMKVRFAPNGDALLMDWNNHRVRRVDAEGKIVTVIGNANIGDGPDDASDLTAPGADGDQVNLNHPTDLVFLPDGKVVLAAWHNHKLRQWDPATGKVMVTCGRGPGFEGDNGPASAALLNQPKSLALDKNGDLYVMDQRNHRIRRIRGADHVIETVVGTGVKGFSGDEGPPLLAQIAQPDGGNPQPGGALALDGQGRLYFSDIENGRIRMVDFAANVIRTIAGTGEIGYSGDGGDALKATFNKPRDIAFGPDGHLYIADTENHVIRRIDLSTNVITTVVGDGQTGFSGDGGKAERARLARPFGITFDAAGNLFIADTFNNRIRRVAAWGN